MPYLSEGNMKCIAYVSRTTANERGITTLEGYMDQSMSRLIQRSFGQARVITANNVYAHVDDLIGMTKAIKELRLLYPPP